MTGAWRFQRHVGAGMSQLSLHRATPLPSTGPALNPLGLTAAVPSSCS